MTFGVITESSTIYQCLGFGDPRCLRTVANSILRCSGVSLSQRSFANPDAKGFLIRGVFREFQRAWAAARISSLRCSGGTLAQRFSAPLRPPSLWALLADFFNGNFKV